MAGAQEDAAATEVVPAALKGAARAARAGSAEGLVGRAANGAVHMVEDNMVVEAMEEAETVVVLVVATPAGSMVVATEWVAMEEAMVALWVAAAMEGGTEGGMVAEVAVADGGVGMQVVGVQVVDMMEDTMATVAKEPAWRVEAEWEVGSRVVLGKVAEWTADVEHREAVREAVMMGEQTVEVMADVEVRDQAAVVAMARVEMA